MYTGFKLYVVKRISRPIVANKDNKTSRHADNLIY